MINKFKKSIKTINLLKFVKKYKKLILKNKKNI